MKKTLTLLFLFFISQTFAQSDADCIARILGKKGRWEQIKNAPHISGADLAMQRKFLEAVHNMLQQRYMAMGVNVQYVHVHSPADKDRPVNLYSYNIDAPHYLCSGDTLSFPSQFGISLNVDFNQFTETPLFDTTDDKLLTGYFDLRHGLPVEIKPGIWQFPDDPESLGFGVTGNSKAWLLTFDGKVPWTYVSRREFLIKRKYNLSIQLKNEDGHLKEQLSKWETEKKYKEQEWKNDPARLGKYIDNTYKPGIEREQKNYERTTADLRKVINEMEEQLTGPAAELDQMAIVKNDPKRTYNYLFTDKDDPFAQILTKPNRAYFNKGLPHSVPHFISIEVIYNHKDQVAEVVANAMVKALDLDYLKSFIGKQMPGAYTGTGSTQTMAMPKEKTQDPAKNPATTIVSSTGNKTPEVAKGNTPAGKSGQLKVFFSAPVNTTTTLSINGKTDIDINIPKTAGKNYSSTSISKANTIPLPLEVQVKKTPAGMSAVIFNGKINYPDSGAYVQVGVDYTNELISRGADDKTFSSFYEGGDYAIGGYNGEEGRYVAFVTYKAGLEGNNGKFRQVYWKDRNTGITKLISSNAAGEQGNGDSNLPSLSADGQLLVFESVASNLVGGDNNNAKDVFLWNARTNTIQLVSKASSGQLGNAESFDAEISGNGRFIVFSSNASNLTTAPKGQSITNVFLYDITKNSTALISLDPVTGSGGNGGKGSISFDGNRISFSSATSTLVKNDNNALWDIFLWQRDQKELKRISMTFDGKERNQGQESATRFVSSSISGNGRYIVYATTATNLIATDKNNFQDVFVYDVETGSVQLISQTADGQQGNNDSPIEQADKLAINYDGTWVAFPTKSNNLGTVSGNIILHNMQTGQKHVVSNVAGGYVGRPALSYSGSYVLFSKSTALDSRFSSSGIFAHFTGKGPTREFK